MIRIGLTDADQVWAFSACTSEHTDETDDFLSSAVADVNVFSSTCINVDDAIYFGHSFNRFGRVSGSISTAAAASPTVVYEYYNDSGSAWTSIASDDLDATFDFGTTGSQDVIIAGSWYEELHAAWAKTSVCGVEAYYLRARVSAVSGGGSGATFSSGSVDITLPDTAPVLRLEKHGRLHTLLDGTRVFDENAEKRYWQLGWVALDMDDAKSLRERVALTRSTCAAFPSNWREDTSVFSVIVDPRNPLVDEYIPPGLHNVTLNLMEE